MFDVFCLSVALAVGQGGPVTPQPIPPAAVPGRAAIGEDLPSRIPPALPTVGVPDTWVPARTVAQDKTPADPKAPAAKDAEPKNGDAEKKNGDEEKKDEEKKEPEKGHFMKLIEGTPLGCKLEAKGIKV